MNLLKMKVKIWIKIQRIFINNQLKMKIVFKESLKQQPRRYKQSIIIYIKILLMKRKIIIMKLNNQKQFNLVVKIFSKIKKILKKTTNQKTIKKVHKINIRIKIKMILQRKI